MTMKTLWLHRPLLNWQDVYRWAIENKVKKLMPPEELHITLATCRSPVDWEDLELHQDIVIVPEGFKTIQIFGFTAKAISFGHPIFKERHAELAERFPTMDHPRILRPHVTLMRGGKMPKAAYEGQLIFGPEEAREFDETKVKALKHQIVDTPDMRQTLGLLDS